MHGLSHLHGNDFPAVQAQLLVVIQHSVHVLNPESIHRPAARKRREPLLLVGRQGNARRWTNKRPCTGRSNKGFLFKMWDHHRRHTKCM